MNKSKLTKVATFIFTLLLISLVGYMWYHHQRAEKAKVAWHDLENRLGDNAAIDTKIKDYKNFIKKWQGTPSLSTACYKLGLLYCIEKTDKDYDQAIQYLTMANFTKGSVLETERHRCLGACYVHTNKLEKALAAYDHVITHAPAYSSKIDALWKKANIYGTGQLQNQEKRRETLQQIVEIPRDGINGDKASLQIIYSAESLLASMN